MTIAIKCRAMPASEVWFLGWNWIFIRHYAGLYHATSSAKCKYKTPQPPQINSKVEGERYNVVTGGLSW